ncbi:MBL fold metallo-hydrolase [Rossellomorea vietnamensis]|uniref:MBL fold metallo-hydrolase n=2 Tax=Rossellomorea TaxID=2837508 RepID=A0A5D4KDT6_9BACI|nr:MULTISPECIES: MBL fold metallo-hydrolase [Rossellomorea]TYR74875.1 MBL fold metallo-hydrolase [Rossellomorea vietnamensis]TYS83305.1 MBL fold metallo-hydrolase [Rossellomorea aquimaris]
MKLTVIGHWGGYPKKNEASSGYLLEEQGFKLLIDCGSGVLSFLQEHVEAHELDAAILSHYHPDHTADIGVLQHALLIQKYLGKHNKSLPFYAHKEDKQGFESLTYKDLMAGIEYNPETTLKAGPFSISFLRTKHPVPCYAMRIEAGGKTLVYTADSAYQESFIPFAKDADLFLCECNFYGDMDGSGAGHMNSLDSGRAAKGAGVKKLVLTHLPHYGNLDNLVQEAKSVFGGEILLAHKDLQLHI